MPSLEGRPYVAVIGSDLGGCVAGSIPDWPSLTMGWHANVTTILVAQERSRFRSPPTQSSEFVPSSCIHSVAAAAQSQDHSVHFPDHDGSAACSADFSRVMRYRLRVGPGLVVRQPEKRKVGSSALPLTTSFWTSFWCSDQRKCRLGSIVLATAEWP
jgi:hypothetical protein